MPLGGPGQLVLQLAQLGLRRVGLGLGRGQRGGGVLQFLRDPLLLRALAGEPGLEAADVRRGPLRPRHQVIHGAGLGGQAVHGAAVRHRGAGRHRGGQLVALAGQLGPGGFRRVPPGRGRGQVRLGHQAASRLRRSGMGGGTADRARGPVGELGGQLRGHAVQPGGQQPQVGFGQRLVRVHRAEQGRVLVREPRLQAGQVQRRPRPGGAARPAARGRPPGRRPAAGPAARRSSAAAIWPGRSARAASRSRSCPAAAATACCAERSAGDLDGQARLGVREMLQRRGVLLGRLGPDEGLRAAAAREHGVVRVRDQPEQAVAGLADRLLRLAAARPAGAALVPPAAPPASRAARWSCPGREASCPCSRWSAPVSLVISRARCCSRSQAASRAAVSAAATSSPAAADRGVLREVRAHLLQPGGPLRTGQLQQLGARAGVQAGRLGRGRHRGADRLPRPRRAAGPRWPGAGPARP